MAVASPEYVSLSLASAMALRFRSGRFYRDARPLCVNLLLTYPRTCLANCAYCGLARERPGSAEEKSFIRLEWPILPTDEVIERLLRYNGQFKRVCLSMVTHPRAYRDTLALIHRIGGCTEAPLSVLVAPNLLDEEKIRELNAVGVDTIGVGLDGASERIFELRRGRAVGGPLSWAGYWRIVAAARQVFGAGKVNCHLIVGLGETDAELVDTIWRLRALGAAAYLFSFYPEPDSRMAKARRPSLRRWRRLQLVKHLLERGQVDRQEICFDQQGRIAHLEVDAEVLRAAIASGLPFVTDGCPDRDGGLACTRPFASYRPGEPFRDYPFPPLPEDLRQIERQLRLQQISASRETVSSLISVGKQLAGAGRQVRP